MTFQARAHTVPVREAAGISQSGATVAANVATSGLGAASVSFDWSAERVAWWVTLSGGIIGIIYYLAPLVRAGTFWALFSRVQGADLLVNETRRRIHDAIREEPGVHLRELARRAGVGIGTLRYHLAHLTRAGLVVVRRQGRHACHALPGMVQTSTRALKAETAVRLAELVSRRPGIPGSAPPPPRRSSAWTGRP